jgi:arylsulfatase A-like enzyme
MRWPGKIPAGDDTWDMLMTIDLFPTIARLIGAELPAHKIDGLDVWPIISRKPGATNPHDAYWFYYEQNQLQAVTTGDGRWKLQVPHTYRTMNGQPPGRDGTPGPYRNVKLEQAELYDLVNDLGEFKNVAPEHADIVQQLEREAEKARAELGDALTKRTGAGQREPGRVEKQQTRR